MFSEWANLDCDFEDFEKCDWQNVDSDDYDWTVNSGSTPSSSTGPTGDYSEGGNESGSETFICLETSLFVFSQTNSENTDIDNIKIFV